MEQIPGNNNEQTSDIIESLEDLKIELERLEENNYLIIHQTFDDAAQRINKADYFGTSGLTGTALLSSTESIVDILPELDKDQRTKLTHKGANSAVIMTYPKESLAGQTHHVLDTIDNQLIDLFAEGKISEVGLPNSQIFGYYHQGRFYKNSNFKPEAILAL